MFFYAQLCFRTSFTRLFCVIFKDEEVSVDKRFTMKMSRFVQHDKSLVRRKVAMKARKLYFEDECHNYKSFGGRISSWLELVFLRLTFVRRQPSSFLLSHTALLTSAAFLQPSTARHGRPYTTWRGVTRVCSTVRKREEEAALVSLCGSRRRGRRTPLAFPKLPCECVARNKVNRRSYGIEKSKEHRIKSGVRVIAREFRDESAAALWCFTLDLNRSSGGSSFAIYAVVGKWMSTYCVDPVFWY